MQITRRQVAVATSVLLIVTALGSFDARAQTGGIVIPDGIPVHIAPSTGGNAGTGRALAALETSPTSTEAGSTGLPPGIELPPGIPVHWFGRSLPATTTGSTAGTGVAATTRPSIPAGIPRHIVGESTPTTTPRTTSTARPTTAVPPTTAPPTTAPTTPPATAPTTTTMAPTTVPTPTTTTPPPPTTTTTTAPAPTTTAPAPPPTTTPVPVGWHAPDHTRRIELTVRTQGTVQNADVVAVPLDASDLVGFDATTARVFAVDAAGAIVTADFAAQLVPDAVHPELLLEWPALAAAGEERQFQLYLAEAGVAPPPAATPPVRVQVNAGTDEGLVGHAIQTDVGRWFLDSDGGGFSSLDDLNGNDWIGWNDAAGDAGRFRGIPNLVFPEGHFHPGNGGVTTTLVSVGPLGARFRGVSNDGQWIVRYDIHPRRLRITVERAAHDYWVLYEGTPGGSLQSGQDRIVKPDSTTVDGGSAFSVDLAPAEWMAVTDTSNLGSLILGAVGDDTVGDHYSSINSMAIAGLGRIADTPALSDIDREYVVALTPTVAVGTLSRRSLALTTPPDRVAMTSTNR